MSTEQNNEVIDSGNALTDIVSRSEQLAAEVHVWKNKYEASEREFLRLLEATSDSNMLKLIRISYAPEGLITDNTKFIRTDDLGWGVSNGEPIVSLSKLDGLKLVTPDVPSGMRYLCIMNGMDFTVISKIREGQYRFQYISAGREPATYRRDYITSEVFEEEYGQAPDSISEEERDTVCTRLLIGNRPDLIEDMMASIVEE